MKIINFLTGVFLALVCTSCYSQDDEFHFGSEQEFKLEVYSQGKVIQESSIDGTSPKIAPLKDIVESKNKHKLWTVSFITYAPLYLVRGRSCNINFQTKHVIVNFKNSSGKYEQLVSDISADEFDRVRTAFGK